MPTPFAEASRLAQIRRMRQVAIAALADYPIDVRRLRLLDHGHNTTFRVDTSDGTRYALRVNVRSNSTEANLTAETAWLAALAEDTDLDVPQPLRTTDGALRTSVHSDDLDRELPVVVMSWLPGTTHDHQSPVELRELGRATAVLHDHAEKWAMPSGAAFPSHADVLVEDERRLFDPGNRLDDDQRDRVDAAYARCQLAIDEAWAADRPRPIHADLHFGNLMWNRGRMSVFDFDDALIGVPVQDLAISTYYLGGRVDGRLDPLFDGYATVRALPSFTDDRFEALVAGRNLLLLNELLGHPNADVRRVVDGYVANTMVKLRAFLETGRYRHDVDGVVDLGL